MGGTAPSIEAENGGRKQNPSIALNQLTFQVRGNMERMDKTGRFRFLLLRLTRSEL